MLSDLTTLVHQNVTKLLLSSVSMVALLFSASEPGQLMPVDPAYLYQDTAGTQPVTATGQSVALQLDQSKGLALGSELVTNGDFSAGTTGWALGAGWSVSGGVAQIVSNPNGGSNLSQTNALPSAGKHARITFSVGSGSSGVLAVFAGASATEYLISLSGEKTYTLTLPVVGVNSIFFQAKSGATVYIDNISVRELPGNHDTQPTVGSRPIYGKHPANGYRNMLASSEDFSAAVWAKQQTTVTANAAIAPDGTMTADRITSSGGAGIRITGQTFSLAATSYTISVWVKAAAAINRKFRLVANQALGSAVGTASTVFEATDEWQKISFTATGGSGYWGITQAASPDFDHDILVWGAQLETGSTATTCQRTGASSGVAWPAPPSYDITEAGQPDLHYLHYNGVSSFMVSPAITPNIDKAQVFVGVRKLSDATTGMLIELSASASANAGTLLLTAPDSASIRYSSASRGTTAIGLAQLADTSSTAYNAPITNVLTAQHDISGDTTSLAINSTVVDIATGDQGTGNFLAYPIYTGRRGGTSLPFNGLVYSKIIRFGANLTANQIASTERWTAQRTGVAIT